MRAALLATLLSTLVATPAVAASGASIDDYRAAIAKNPGDVDARAALVDRLIWSRQFDEADRELDRGLSLNPAAPSLLARRAQLLHFRGDTGAGRPYLRRAEALAPADIDIRTLGDRMWVGEGRLRMHREWFPKGWDDISLWELSVSQRVGRATLGVRTEQWRRPATPYAGGGTYNGFYAASLAYALGIGWTVGVEGGFGAPAPAVPEALGRAFLYFPLAGPLDGYAAYSYFTYASGVRVNMVNPAIGLQITDSLRIDARYWLARTSLSNGEGKVVHSVGSYAIYRVVPRFAVDFLYVYGTQLDRSPALFQLLDIRSHFLAPGVDWRIARALGIRPQYQLEIRRNPNGDVIRVHTGELAVYVRW